MSELKRFLKQNKKTRENVKYIATKSLTDEQGNPLEWTIKPLSTNDSQRIQDECIIEVPIKGKMGAYRQKFDTNKYITKMLCESVVVPNLYDKELQDSYGVMTPEALLKAMIDNPGEYTDFSTFVQKFNGFTDIEDAIETAKN